MATIGDGAWPLQPKEFTSEHLSNASTPPQRLSTEPPSQGSSKENATHPQRHSTARKPLPADAGTRIHGTPLSPVTIQASREYFPQASSAQIEVASPPQSRDVSWEYGGSQQDAGEVNQAGGQNWSSLPIRQPDSRYSGGSFDYHKPVLQSISNVNRSESPRIVTSESGGLKPRDVSDGSLVDDAVHDESAQPLQYHHLQGQTDQGYDNRRPRNPVPSSSRNSSPGPNASLPNRHLSPANANQFSGDAVHRPNTMFSGTPDLGRGRTLSPQLSPNGHPRPSSSRSGRSLDDRPISYVDLLNVPYPQPPPAPTNLDNAHLRGAVGANASLLSTKQTLEMYRANVKKTNDPTIQYEFAVFMINAARESGQLGGSDYGGDGQSGAASQTDLLKEARQILQRLSDRSYPFAQYYLADGYASGLFNKGKEDNDRAFPLFVAASKHGHAEAGYRAALCYEYGWGTRKDFQKATQFYRQAASKNHPGAMSRLGRACLIGDLGLVNRYKEGLKWLKRAAESADFQYNAAPYELGLLHEKGYGADVFQDESYAAQLFTQSADLGHAEANYRLGDAYEHGKLSCPKDPALSVHFYTGAAQSGHPLAMMALCAWYMIGAEPVLEKDESEAYQWARKAAECGKSSYHKIHATRATANLRSQAFRRLNMLLGTSPRWALDVAEILWRPMSGTSGPQTKVTKGQSTASQLYEPRPLEDLSHNSLGIRLRRAE